jgi:hypothetical protein
MSSLTSLPVLDGPVLAWLGLQPHGKNGRRRPGCRVPQWLLSRRDGGILDASTDEGKCTMPTQEQAPYEAPVIEARTAIDTPFIGGPVASGTVSAVFR